MATRLKDGYLTIPEVAQELGVAESAVWRWIREERLQAFRLGNRRILVKRDDMQHLTAPERPRKLEFVDITDRAVLERQRNRPGYHWTPIDESIREAKDQRDRRPDFE